MQALAKILEDLLAEAMQKGKSHRKLHNGLHIKIETDIDGNVLTLARELQYPSLQEWDTVTKYFPYFVPSMFPNKDRKNGFFTISAKLPLRQAEQLKFG